MPGTNDSGDADERVHVRTQRDRSLRQWNLSSEPADPETWFEDPVRPRREEAISALVATGFLSALEAEAYLRYAVERQDPETDRPKLDEKLEPATEKIAAAREAISILDAYYSPEFPDECAMCGAHLGDVWTLNLEQVSLCLDCAEVGRPELEE